MPESAPPPAEVAHLEAPEVDVSEVHRDVVLEQLRERAEGRDSSEQAAHRPS